MKFYQECNVIAFLIIGTALYEVQGKNIRDSSRVQEKAAAASGSLEVTKQNLLNDFITLDIPANSSSFGRSNKIFATKKRLKTSKSYAFENSKISKRSYPKTNTNQNINLLRSQKVYCRQVKKSEPNGQGDIFVGIQHICASVATTTDPQIVISFPTTPSYHQHTNTKSNIVSSLHQGINCRRVMNSELNELGEIVDSLTELCDPPPTTTTTTRRPPTTPKVTTTTARPLVKICWPVMDSYLNEEGKIVDSVTTFCKMQPARPS